MYHPAQQIAAVNGRTSIGGEIRRQFSPLTAPSVIIPVSGNNYDFSSLMDGMFTKR